MRFRKKPVVIEARQYTRVGLEAERVAAWCGGRQTDSGLLIETLVGERLAEYGDWVICSVAGDFSICKPRVFKAIYDPE